MVQQLQYNMVNTAIAYERMLRHTSLVVPLSMSTKLWQPSGSVPLVQLPHVNYRVSARDFFSLEHIISHVFFTPTKAEQQSRLSFLGSVEFCRLCYSTTLSRDREMMKQFNFEGDQDAL